MNNLIKPLDVSDSVNNALTNISDDPTKRIGKTLGDLWFLVFGDFWLAARKREMKYDKELSDYYNELHHSIEEIPEELRIEPSLQVTAQALENSKYCISSESLREMFIKLISGTMNRNIESHIHPSFPEIIKQMSENDAFLIRHFKKCTFIPIANIGLSYTSGSITHSHKHISSLPDVPLSTQQCCVSISALEKFGLLETTYTEWLSDDSIYEKIKKTDSFRSAKDLSKSKGASVNFEKGICRLTYLGSEFIKVCL